MYTTATILLIGLMSFAGGQVEQARSARAGAGSSRRPDEVRRILSEQVREWRIDSREMTERSPQEILKEVPDVAELETRIWPHWREVSLLLVKEMRGPGDVWQKIYVGRALVALLERASGEELVREERSLILASRSAPGTVRRLSEPRGTVRKIDDEEFRKSVEKAIDEEDEDKLAELREERLRTQTQARRQAERRGYEDEQIVLVNQGVEVLSGDFTRLLLRSGGPTAYRAVLGKLARQLADSDAAFEKTLAALGAVRREELDPRQEKLLLNSLNALQRRHGGKRLYTVYTEVRRSRRRPLAFGEREIDFSASLRDLRERWQRGDVGSEESLEEPAKGGDVEKLEEGVPTEENSSGEIPGDER